MFKTRLPILHAFAGVIALTAYVHADGYAMKRRPDTSGWLPLTETMQRAVIDHRDGIQTMCLSVHLELDDPRDQGLWIFPVPGTAEDVEIDLVDQSPVFHGYNPKDAVHGKVGTLLSAIRVSQVWSFFLEAILMPSLSRSSLFGEARVLQSVDHWGLRTELIDVDSLEALSDYFQQQGVTIEHEMLNPFEEYLNGDYLLVATWIQSFEEVRDHFEGNNKRSKDKQGRWPSVLVRFPTEKPWYPMKPTAAYGDESVPLLLYLTGFYELDTSESGPHLYSKCFLRKNDYDSRFSFLAFNGGGATDPYTVFRSFGKASGYTEDMSFSPIENNELIEYGKIDRTFFSGLRSYIILPGIYLIWSYVCGGLAGLFMWRSWKRPALWCLWNITSVVGLYFILRDTRFVNKMDPDTLPTRYTLRSFLWCFSLLFAGIPTAIQLYLIIP